MPGTILGRPPNLFVGLIGAIVNAAALFHLFGFNPTADQATAVNTVVLFAIATIANAPFTDHNALAKTQQ